MIYLSNRRAINPAFVEALGAYKATLSESALADGDKEPYYLVVDEDTHWTASEDVVVVRYASGTVLTYCGDDGNAILWWYGMLEGPAPTDDTLQE